MVLDGGNLFAKLGVSAYSSDSSSDSSNDGEDQPKGAQHPSAKSPGVSAHSSDSSSDREDQPKGAQRFSVKSVFGESESSVEDDHMQCEGTLAFPIPFLPLTHFFCSFAEARFAPRR